MTSTVVEGRFEPLLTCECGSTWWQSSRHVQVLNSQRKWTAPNCEDPAHMVRNVLVCVECSEIAPEPS